MVFELVLLVHKLENTVVHANIMQPKPKTYDCCTVQCCLLDRRWIFLLVNSEKFDRILDESHIEFYCKKLYLYIIYIYIYILVLSNY